MFILQRKHNILNISETVKFAAVDMKLYYLLFDKYINSYMHKVLVCLFFSKNGGQKLYQFLFQVNPTRLFVHIRIKKYFSCLYVLVKSNAFIFEIGTY